MAVHDVDVEDRGSALDGGLRIFAEPCEVSRENGGSEFDHGMLIRPLADQRATWALGASPCVIFSIRRRVILSPRRRPTGRGSSLLLTTGSQEMP